MEADGSSPLNLTNNPATWEPAVTADGTRMVFASNRGGFQNLWVMGADGSHPMNVTDHPGEDAYPTWSPDGSKIAFHTTRDGVSIFAERRQILSGRTERMVVAQENDPRFRKRAAGLPRRRFG